MKEIENTSNLEVVYTTFVDFIKSTMFKSQIENGTVKGDKDFWEL